MKYHAVGEKKDRKKSRTCQGNRCPETNVQEVGCPASRLVKSLNFRGKSVRSVCLCCKRITVHYLKCLAVEKRREKLVTDALPFGGASKQ
jgi:hypothetical protein